MKFIRFISTGGPVVVKAAGMTFAVKDGAPSSVMLDEIDHDRETLDV